MRIPVLMDCDPGHDDAIAILIALVSDKLDVKLVTTVAGNQTVQKTTNNALKVISFAGRQVEVAKGAAKPLIRELMVAPEVHGDTGLDGPVLPEPAFEASDRTAVEAMYDVIMNSSQKVVLIPTAALTNVATLLMTHPEVKEKIQRISLMGGACIGGNWTPAAEFNILVDPEAASIVFQAGIPITMCGLDVTHKAWIFREDIERIRSIGGKVAVMVAELLDFFEKFHLKFGFEASPLHDPCAVAALIAPELFKTKAVHVDIETSGEFTTGATVVDWNDVQGKTKNVDIAYDIDRKGFVDLLCESMLKYE